ncbi:uncharacterized protein LOC120341085 [Styela clava]
MVAPKHSENGSGVAEYEIYLTQTKPQKKNTSYNSTISSVSLYLFAFMMGFGIMALYTQFVIKTQVTVLVRAIEKEKENLDQMQVQDVEENMKQNSDILRRAKREWTSQWDYPAAHLIGHAGPNDRTYGNQIPQYGNFFRWTLGQNSFSLMELDESETGTLIVVNTRGYYMVYSQVTYSGHGLFKIGHETVKIAAGNGDESVLMKSLNTQQLSTAKSGIPTLSRSYDSNYHAGVFYLHPGDKVGVKPWNYGRNHTYASQGVGLYFGMAFLHH